MPKKDRPVEFSSDDDLPNSFDDFEDSPINQAEYEAAEENHGVAQEHEAINVIKLPSRETLNKLVKNTNPPLAFSQYIDAEVLSLTIDSLPLQASNDAKKRLLRDLLKKESLATIELCHQKLYAIAGTVIRTASDYQISKALRSSLKTERDKVDSQLTYYSVASFFDHISGIFPFGFMTDNHITLNIPQTPNQEYCYFPNNLQDEIISNINSFIATLLPNDDISLASLAGFRAHTERLEAMSNDELKSALNNNHKTLGEKQLKAARELIQVFRDRLDKLAIMQQEAVLNHGLTIAEIDSARQELTNHIKHHKTQMQDHAMNLCVGSLMEHPIFAEMILPVLLNGIKLENQADIMARYDWQAHQATQKLILDACAILRLCEDNVITLSSLQQHPKGKLCLDRHLSFHEKFQEFIRDYQLDDIHYYLGMASLLNTNRLAEIHTNPTYDYLVGKHVEQYKQSLTILHRAIRPKLDGFYAQHPELSERIYALKIIAQSPLIQEHRNSFWSGGYGNNTTLKRIKKDLQRFEKDLREQPDEVNHAEEAQAKPNDGIF